MSQILALRKLLKIACNIPAYKEKFQNIALNKSFLNNADDEQLWATFQKIPLVNKQELRNNTHQFLAQVDDIVYRGVTSGTTAEALIYFRDSIWNQKRREGIKKFLSWWKIDDKLPILNLNSRLFPLRENDSSLIGIVDNFFIKCLEISTEKPVVFRGFPSRLCEVALLASHQINLSNIKGIICTGEPLFPHQKQLLENTFLAPVINEYGSQECGIYGFSCPLCGEIHIDEERCLIEVQKQVLIVTDLYSNVMPLIRYCNSDLVDINHNSNCPNSKTTFKILGRIEHNLSSYQDYPIIPEVTYYRSIPSINNNKLIGYLSPKSKWLIEPKLKTELTHIIGEDTEIEFYKFSNAFNFYQQTIPNLANITEDIKKLDTTNQLSKILTSRRWIFYHLPHCLIPLINQLTLEENLDLETQLKQERLFLLLQIISEKPCDNFPEILTQLFLKYQNTQKLNLIYLDLLIIALFYSQKELFLNLQTITINFKITLDTLSYRLLLTLISQNIQKARLQNKKPLITKLTPLLPLFISDLDLCKIYGKESLLGILAHWTIILNCLPCEEKELSHIFQRPSQLNIREINLKEIQNIHLNKNLDLSLLNLQELKELCIKITLYNLDIKPTLLLEEIKSKLGENKQQELSKKLAFIPFMRYFSQLFIEEGNRKKARECLLMSQNISLMQDDFEYSSRFYNFKQKIF